MDHPFIKINYMNIITSNRYNNISNTDCVICRKSIYSDSIYAIENNIESTIRTGQCGHGFHNECINPWLTNNKKCPICSEPF